MTQEKENSKEKNQQSEKNEPLEDAIQRRELQKKVLEKLLQDIDTKTTHTTKK